MTEMLHRSSAATRLPPYKGSGQQRSSGGVMEARDRDRCAGASRTYPQNNSNATREQHSMGR
jgi:hypothetical protein